MIFITKDKVKEEQPVRISSYKAYNKGIVISASKGETWSIIGEFSPEGTFRRGRGVDPLLGFKLDDEGRIIIN